VQQVPPPNATPPAELPPAQAPPGAGAGVADDPDRFRQLLEGLEAIAVQGYDRQRRVIFWNSASERLYGWTREEALGRQLEDLIIPAPMRPYVIDAVEGWMAQGTLSMPAEALDLQHKDGHTVPVLSSHTLRQRSNGEPEMYCVDIDLKPRRDAEQALRAAQQRLELALAGGNDGIWDWNLDAGELYVSPRFRELLGYADEAAFRAGFGLAPAVPLPHLPADDVVGALAVRAGFDLRHVIHPDDAAAVVAALDAHLLHDGPPFDHTYRLRTAGGTWRWVHGRGRALRDAAGRALRFAGAMSDITDRVEAEQALRASEERFRSLTALSADWYWETDAAHRFSALGGGLPERDSMVPGMLGRCRWEVPCENLTAADWAVHRAALDRHEPFRDMEVHRRDDGGRLRVYRSSGTPRFDEAGRFTGYHGVGRDETELFEAQQRHERLQAQLRESQKLEALGTLAGGVAHDFNNVLGVLLGTLGLARQDLAQGLPVQGRLDQIEGAALRARQLVQQILAFSRRQQPELRPRALQPLVQDVHGLLRATLPAAVTLRLALPEEALVADLDAAQIHQVLMNLGINAWQALHGRGGEIEIGAVADDTVHPDGRVEPGLRLWVGDSGCGMDEETQRRAFEPFFTTKAPGEGTGLGLSVVHGIVTGHGGRITVQSSPGAGSTFTIRMRRCTGPAAPAAQPPVVVAAAGHGERVLLVDDDDVVRLISAETLSRAGYRVSGHARAAEALQALRREPEGFDLIVTDYNMPGASGLELAAEALTIAPRVPVLLTSGYLADGVREAARRGGVCGIVPKERIREDLLPRVAEALARRGAPEAVPRTAWSPTGY
jgi:PAS domain S-box-containing protein